MCFFSKQSKSAIELENRFNAKFVNPDEYIPSVYYNAFQFPNTPVIINTETDKIKLFSWGLIPHWAKDNSIRKNTINARIETIKEKPAFKASVNKRCLVLADGFYEWQWLDEKGKQKQKYLVTLPDNEPFGFAGLWSEWLDKTTGELINTYTILTTDANELMSKIHNSKKRMPILLSQENEKEWLSGQNLKSQNDRLIAIEI
jgi:putative SOS response-associated peptidase YedK